MSVEIVALAVAVLCIAAALTLRHRRIKAAPPSREDQIAYWASRAKPTDPWRR